MTTDTNELTISLENITRVALCTPMTSTPDDPSCIMGAPLMIEGPPGIGKSARIKEASLSMGLECETVFVPVRQPEEFGGIVVPAAAPATRTALEVLKRLKVKQTTFSLTVFLAQLAEAADEVIKNLDANSEPRTVCMLQQVRNLVRQERGVLFLDEINWAGRAVQGALLGAVLARQFGDQVLPPGVRIIAAGNAAEETDGGYTMIPPLANRFLWFRVGSANVEEWNNWRRSRYETVKAVAIERLEDDVKRKWKDVAPQYDALIASFMTRRGSELLHNLPATGNKERHRAWPSPRSWDVAIRVAVTASILGLKKFESQLIAAAVGDGAATEWMRFKTEMDLPDPLHVLQHGFEPDHRLDRATAVYAAATNYVLSRTDPKEKRDLAIRCWRLLDQACTAGMADCILSPASSLTKAGFTAVSMKEMGIAHDEEVATAAGKVTAKLGKSGIVRAGL